jgi:N-acetylglutamate synthase-like GNAT family acetyltransferase
MTSHVRRLEPGDVPEVCAIMNAAIATMAGLNAAARSFIVAKNTPEAVAEELARVFALVAVGAHGLEAVGVLDGAEIKRLYVHPDCQRRGTGASLARALEAEARRQGLQRLQLQASPSSVGFYSRLGFTEVGRETTQNGDAEFVHVQMVKQLT